MGSAKALDIAMSLALPGVPTRSICERLTTPHFITLFALRSAPGGVVLDAPTMHCLQWTNYDSRGLLGALECPVPCLSFFSSEKASAA